MKKWIYIVGIVILIIIAIVIYGANKSEVGPGEQSNTLTDASVIVSTSTDMKTDSASASVSSSIKKNNSTNKMEQISKAGDTLTVHYTGTLENGTKFDSSVDRGAPFKFIVGIGQVIRGWDEGMVGMKIGEKKKLVIPGEKAYGASGIPDGNGGYIIPPNATLIFDVELLGIETK